MEAKESRILVTGATGYVGGRLVPRLMEKVDAKLRILVRDATRIEGRKWNGVEIFEGDVADFEFVKTSLKDVKVAFYLIHSMLTGEKQFADRDLKAAENFGRAAFECGVEKIIYLGGLGDSENEKLSLHLKSRQETGQCLANGGVPVIEFRAGMIIGSGSLSFEMLRHLTERVPIMVAPKWIKTRSQPIAIRDVLAYLISAVDYSPNGHEIFEIGGPDRLSYEQMIRIYAEERKLKRRIIPVPVLTPRLSSYWVNLVTPIPSAIARPLIDGLKNELLVHSEKAISKFHITPTPFVTALRLALERTLSEEIETRWTSALSSSLPTGRMPVKLEAREGLVREERSVFVKASPERAFDVISSLGGQKGYFYLNWLWQIRGWIDRLLGGVGLRRGRRASRDLQVGDAIDFWRVEALEESKLLRLRAEMKVPGKAWLEFQLISHAHGCQIIQRALFEPKGLFGLIYWYGIYPLHAVIFGGMIRAIAHEIEGPNWGLR